MIPNRLRNSSLRLLLFNNLGKFFRNQTLALYKLKENIIIGNYEAFKSYYYETLFQYYSLEEEDRSKLEMMFALFI